jgi:hypothetical protein
MVQRSRNVESAVPQGQSRSRQCQKCGKSLQEREVFTFNDEEYCESCYLGEQGLGPLEEQYIECPHCKQKLNKFTVVCFACKNPIREVGKVEAEVKYMGLRVLGFFVAFLIFVVGAVILGPMRVEQGGSQTIATFMGVFGPIFGLAGLFRLLFGMVFKKIPILSGPLGKVLGVLLCGLGLLLVALLPFP